jgi:YidC/Oxa1 family membrane protein insertase
MFDSKSGEPGESKELSIETRLLLAFLLMGAVLFTTPYFFKSTQPPPPAKKTESAATPPAPTPASSPVETAAAGAVPSSVAPAGQISAPKEDIATVDTDLYKVVFSNRGAVVKSWILKKYKDSNKQPLELINFAAAAEVGYPFTLIFKTQKPSVDVNSALYAVKYSDDGLTLTFEYSDGKVFSRKAFHFLKDRYLVQVSTEVTDGGAPVPSLIAWRGGFGDMSVPSPPAAQHTIHYDSLATGWASSAGKLVTNTAKDAKNGPVIATGSFSFAGMEDGYFTGVFLPSGGTTEIQTFGDKVPSPLNPAPELFAGVAVGGDGVNRLGMFVGPKDLDIMKRVNPKLEQVVDFGWFSLIAKPLFLVMHWLTDTYVHNYGWSIILVTIFINIALFPLKISSLKSMKKMQTLQPQIAAINEKYKNVGLRDAKKQDQNQEVMALYSKHGVNPLGGCLPMALQMPFLYAFYKVFAIAIEMRGASWLWVMDLSRPETLPIHLLPIAMVATQFITQKMTPASPGSDPSQQKVMMLMPLMFGFMFYSASAGLVLYWLTGNLVNIAQQWFFNRTAVPVDATQSVQVIKKKNGRK